MNNTDIQFLFELPHFSVFRSQLYNADLQNHDYFPREMENTQNFIKGTFWNGEGLCLRANFKTTARLRLKSLKGMNRA